MTTHTLHEFAELSEALAFLGNTLLSPMNQTEHMGLDQQFWAQFPTFGDADAKEAVAGLRHFAQGVADAANPVQDVSVEFTRLFVGPPAPLAAPWETFYRHEGVEVGFGAATFEMRERLRAAGLEVSNANNQYADHVGIELLYLSVLCKRAAEGDGEAAQAAVDFAHDVLGVWIEKLQRAVADAEPGGYFAGILALASALVLLV